MYRKNLKKLILIVLKLNLNKHFWKVMLIWLN